MTKRIGAPSKLPPELTQQICDTISQGNYIEVACQAVGIDDATYYRYVALAKEALEKPPEDRTESEESYIAFYDAVKKAHAVAELDLNAKIINPLYAKDWQRFAWILERTRQDRYALRSKLDLSSKEPIKIIFESVKEATD